MGCEKTKKFVHGIRKQVKGRQQTYSELADKIHARITRSKADKAMLFDLYEQCGIKFADVQFKDTSMQQLMKLIEKVELQQKNLGTNALHIFGEGTLNSSLEIELFLENADLAVSKNITGTDKLFLSINGKNNVRGVDYTFRAASHYGADFAKVEGFETSIAAEAYRGCDIKFTERIKLPKNGEMRVAELKSGPAMDLNVKQGIKGLAELEAMGLENEPTLFRFIHNTDPNQSATHLPKQAQNFLEQIHTTANLATPEPGSKAAKKVIEKLEGQGWLKDWNKTDSLGAWVAGGADATEIAARQKQASAAVQWMQDWFYVQYNIAYPP